MQSYYTDNLMMKSILGIARLRENADLTSYSGTTSAIYCVQNKEQTFTITKVVTRCTS